MAEKSALDVTRFDLEQLLAPVSTQTFLDEYWDKRPLFVKGTPNKFAGLINRQRFFEILDLPWPEGTSYNIRASFDGKPDESGQSPQIELDAPDVIAAYQVGATVCVSGINQQDPALAQILKNVRAQIGYPGPMQFNCYLSSDGGGFARHFDARIVVTMQLEGKKTWRFSNTPALPWPPANGMFGLRADVNRAYPTRPDLDGEEWATPREFDERDFTEVLLEPGDVLVLPAGAYHEVRAEKGDSLSIALTFDPVSVGAFIGQLLQENLMAEEHWRSVPPLQARPLEAIGEHYRERAVRQLAERLAEAADFLKSLQADDTKLRRAWGAAIIEAGQEISYPSIAGYFLKKTEAPSVNPDDILQLPPGKMHYHIMSEGNSKLTLFVGDREVQFEGKALGLILEIIRRGTFRAKEACTWPIDGAVATWSQIKGILEHMVSLGMLEARS